MTNRMKAKGDRFERDVLAYVRAHGFPDAERTRAGYERDAGDIHLDPSPAGPSMIVQAKDVKTPQWSEWLEGLSAQQAEAGARWGFIALKRSRPGKPPLRLAVMDLDQMTNLLKELEDHRERAN